MKIDFLSEIFKKENIGKEFTVFGWIKSVQVHKSVVFVNINDGSTIKNLQLVYKKQDLAEADLTIGSSIESTGKLITSSRDPKNYEFESTEIKVLSLACGSFPIQKKEVGLPFLRQNAHQRHRTKYMLAISLIKQEVNFAVHNYFHSKKFFHFSPPILSTNSCEGGSDVFELSKEGSEFFKKRTLLTVSGQLFAEAMALGLKNVYVLSPTFRAEKSNSSHHLAEFWMLEIEMHATDLRGMLILIEDFIKNVTKHVVTICKEELEYLSEKLPENEKLIPKLENLLTSKFPIVEYSKAIEILQDAVQNKKTEFLNKDIHFGMNLSSEHEMYISEVVYKSPVFVINYPKAIKAFYMKQNDDNLTVAGVDFLAPGIGELIGGSERESDVEKIRTLAEYHKISLDEIDWYLNIRRYGYYKSSGFGLGFERLIMYYTGATNIKEAATFPTSYKNIL